MPRLRQPDEGPMTQDFNAPKYPVAAKSHRCIYCVERIAPGTRHLHFTGVWEGDWQDWRMHKECEAAHDASQDEYSEGEICNHRHLRGYTCQEMQIRARIIHGN